MAAGLRSVRSGFGLIEALTAIVILGLAGTVTVAAVGQSLRSLRTAEEHVRALAELDAWTRELLTDRTARSACIARGRLAGSGARYVAECAVVDGLLRVEAMNSTEGYALSTAIWLDTP